MQLIQGKPIIRRIMDGIIASGVHEFIVIANPQDGDLVSYLSVGGVVDADIRIVFQPEPRGTADALRCAAPLINGDFLLSACDNLVQAEDIQRMLNRWHTIPQPDALLALLKLQPEEIVKSSVIVMEGEKISRIIEKPALGVVESDIASLPLYIFTPTLLSLLDSVPLSSRGEYELQDAIQAFIDRGHKAYGLMIAFRLALNTAADLLAINKYYQDNEKGR
jgi:glucose-1-phosphate thymidylyltransferase